MPPVTKKKKPKARSSPTLTRLRDSELPVCATPPPKEPTKAAKVKKLRAVKKGGGATTTTTKSTATSTTAKSTPTSKAATSTSTQKSSKKRGSQWTASTATAMLRSSVSKWRDSVKRKQTMMGLPQVTLSSAPGKPMKRRVASPPPAGLDQETYYHGYLPFRYNEFRMKREGNFLVRKEFGKSGCPSRVILSVSTEHLGRHKIVHATINKKKNNPRAGWSLGKVSRTTVPELIDFYCQTSRGVAGDGEVADDAVAVLLHPVNRQAWQISHDSIQVHQKLGEGAFGEVMSATVKLLDPKKKVWRTLPAAVKVATEAISQDTVDDIVREAKVMQKLRHDCIVQFYGVAAERHPMMLVMEKVDGGSLSNYLKSGRRLDAFGKVGVLSSAARGLAYLHEQGCVHRDIAARNCLINASTRLVKIADFGLSRKKSDDDDGDNGKKRKTRMPVRWLAPEVLNKRQFSASSDVWAFGVLVWEVLSDGADPYPNMARLKDVSEFVCRGGRMKPPANAPRTLCHLLERCWDKQPERRPGMDTIAKYLGVSSLFSSRCCRAPPCIPTCT